MGTPATRPRGRRRADRPVVDRVAILDAAERVIEREGSGASIEAIATEAGVTKPIVYDRIGSRADLSDALAERFTARILEAARDGAETVGLDDRAALSAMFRQSLQVVGDHRELFLFVTRGSSDDTPQRALALAQMSAAPLAEAIDELRRDRGLDRSVAEPWAYGIVGMINMVATWWIHEPGRDPRELADQLGELVWAGLGRGS